MSDKQKELDDALFKEAVSENPAEERIRELVSVGAKMENEFLSTVIFCLNRDERKVNLKIIQLLIDLGAQVNYADKESSPLYDATLAFDPDLVELLLKAGSNPNVIIDAELNRSLLDWAYTDKGSEHTQGETQNVKNLERIIQLLLEYGAVKGN